MLYSYQTSYAIAYVDAILVRIPRPILPPCIVPPSVKGSEIIFQKIIFPENKANNSTYRHQKQTKSWGGEMRRSRGEKPYHLARISLYG